MMNTLEESREFFSHDRFATENGIIIEGVEKGRAVVTLEIEPKHLNAAGTVMGGCIFTMCDFCSAVASNFEEEKICVTADSNISYISAARGKSLKCIGECVKDGRSLTYYKCTVTDENDKQVAIFTTTMFKR